MPLKLGYLKKKKKKIEQEKNKLSEFSKKNFAFLSDICTDNMCLSFLISHLLMRKGIFKEFCHQCDDFERVSLVEGKKNCTCDILELIIRFNSMFDSSVQNLLKNLFYNLFVNLEFKKQLAVVFSRMNVFLINFEILPNGKIKSFESELHIIFYQFYSDELADAYLENNILENSLIKMQSLLTLIKGDSFAIIYEKLMDYYYPFEYMN